MYYYYIFSLSVVFVTLSGMERRDCQFELNPLRKEYRSSLVNNNQKKDIELNVVVEKPCVFCDQDSLKDNDIISENKDDDVRVMLNKFPYFGLNQGIHFLVMPISHKEHLSDFCYTKLMNQVKVIQQLNAKFDKDAYTLEYVLNLGILAGRSVSHLHGHLKVFTQPAMSLPERIKWNNDNQQITIEDAFATVKAILESKDNVVQSFSSLINPFDCECCTVTVTQSEKNDNHNWVIDRFEHNYVCLAHYPSLPAEIAIVPYSHVPSIKDLSLEALSENMALVKVLLGMLPKYVNEHIRECDGGNVYIKSMGYKMSSMEKKRFHVYTRLMPRTTISLTPGNFDNNSCKLDFNPLHLFDHLKKINFKELIKD